MGVACSRLSDHIGKRFWSNGRNLAIREIWHLATKQRGCYPMRIFSRLIWLVMFCAWSLLTVWTSVQAWRAYNSRYWPVTDGVVTAFYGTPDFTYTVAGKTYTGSYVSCNEFFDTYLFVSNSSKYAVKYPLQATVKVHYFPADPSLAALETAFDSRVIGEIAILVLVSTVCFAGLIFGWR